MSNIRFCFHFNFLFLKEAVLIRELVWYPFKGTFFGNRLRYIYSLGSTEQNIIYFLGLLWYLNTNIYIKSMAWSWYANVISSTMIMYYINSDEQIQFCCILLLHFPFSFLCDNNINFIKEHVVFDSVTRTEFSTNGVVVWKD